MENQDSKELKESRGGILTKPLIQSPINIRPKGSRPIFKNVGIFDIVAYYLPPSGWVSILHRITGVGMLFWVPIALYLWELSLFSLSGFETVSYWLAHPLMKGLIILTLWSVCHHLLAGLRFFLIDLQIGVDKVNAIRSSYIVLGLGKLITILIAWNWIL